MSVKQIPVKNISGHIVTNLGTNEKEVLNHVVPVNSPNKMSTFLRNIDTGGYLSRYNNGYELLITWTDVILYNHSIEKLCFFL